MIRAYAWALVACAVVLCSPSLAGATVTHAVTTLNGIKVDRYSWPDSNGRARTVSLKQEGAGNPGHGGYAVQMTYYFLNDGTWRRRVVNHHPDDPGFGYFVGHEAWRTFTSGPRGTIAGRFGADDSPLGRSFPVTGAAVPGDDPNKAVHRFKMTYPRYGTVDPIPKNEDGEDSTPVPTDLTELARYDTPVAIYWYFQSGTDFPRIRTRVSLADVELADRVNFDVRGPYGVMDFDSGDQVITRVMWGDRLHFTSSGSPLTRNSEWTWNRRNDGARYTALIASKWEMGLLEPRPLRSSALDHGFAFGRGRTSDGYDGCAEEGWILPCDWEWPYQSAQYSLPYDDNDGTTTYEKIAWGSAPYYGAGPSLPQVWDSTTHPSSFVGFPAGGAIVYDVCVVLGRTIPGGLTRTVAAGPDYRCASA